MLSGQTLSARDALALGLVDEVVEAELLLDRALDRAEELARIPAETFTLTKAQLRRRVSERIAAGEATDADQVLDSRTSASVRQAIAGYLDQLAARRTGSAIG
jgi:enoyl-CoA hydratase